MNSVILQRVILNSWLVQTDMFLSDDRISPQLITQTHILLLIRSGRPILVFQPHLFSTKVPSIPPPAISVLTPCPRLSPRTALTRPSSIHLIIWSNYHNHFVSCCVLYLNPRLLQNDSFVILFLREAPTHIPKYGHFRYLHPLFLTVLDCPTHFSEKN